MLAKGVERTGKDWDGMIISPTCCFPTELTQTSTQESPFYLLYGRDPRLLRDEVSALEGHRTIDLKDCKMEMSQRIAEAWRLAQCHVEKAQKEYYDCGTVTDKVHLGDRVFVYNLIPRAIAPMRGSSATNTGITLASPINTAINQCTEARLVALDIKGAFDSVWWKGLLVHLWSVGFRGKAFKLFESYLSNCYIRVVTPLDSSDLHPVIAGASQGAIWSPPLFNLYIRKLSTVMKHSLIVGYTDDHSLLKTIQIEQQLLLI